MAAVRNGDAFWCDRCLLFAPYFGLALTEQAFRKAVKRLGIKDRIVWQITPTSGATAHYLKRTDGASVVLIAVAQERLDERKWSRDEVRSLLVHEGAHVFQQFRRDINESHPCDELEAYGMEKISLYLFEAYRLALKRYRKKARKVKKQ